MEVSDGQLDGPLQGRLDRAADNESLVKAVYEQLNRERPDSLHYATFKLPDGVSFMHLVVETDQPGKILKRGPAFQAFVTDIAVAARSRRSSPS